MLFLILFLGRLGIAYYGIENIYFHTIMRNVITVLFVIMDLSLFQKIQLKNSLWVWFGRRSLEIYMIHYALRTYYSVQVGNEDWYVLIICGFTLVLSMAVLGYKKLVVDKSFSYLIAM